MTARSAPGAALIEAGPAHALIMAEIHASAFAEDERWDAAMIAGWLGMPGVWGLLHAKGGVLLGRNAADESEILTLGVMQSARRQGLGLALVNGACAQAQRRGAARLFLEVSTGNAAGRALYARAGFTETGRRTRYYADGSDALVLTRELPDAPV